MSEVKGLKVGEPLPNSDSINSAPFETEELRVKLSEFLDQPVNDPNVRNIGNYQWGVYAFYDYDGEPIYVGQTNEKLRVRIRRHLTNQRTDAVAMSVLDPFEVHEIRVWPLPQYQGVSRKNKAAREHLDALERFVYEKALMESQFGAVLNEKDPPQTSYVIAEEPASYRATVVSPRVEALRGHPDTRIAQRAQTISRLSNVISSRKVKGGLRRVLVVQAERLASLARRRYEALGGASSIENEAEGDD